MRDFELILFLFGVILILNFCCQLYISSVFHNEQGLLFVLGACLCVPKLFKQGWQEADTLIIKDVMIIWSILLGAFIFLSSTLLLALLNL